MPIITVDSFIIVCTILGHKDIVKLLLSKKADFTMRDSDGKTALHRAAENNHTEICDILIDHFPPLKDVPDNKGNKPKLD